MFNLWINYKGTVLDDGSGIIKVALISRHAIVLMDGILNVITNMCKRKNSTPSALLKKVCCYCTKSLFY